MNEITNKASAMSKAMMPTLANNSQIAFLLNRSISCNIGKKLLSLHRTPQSLNGLRITFV